MKKYEKYKDSGVAWIGKIPEKWEVVKLRNIGIFTASGIDKKTNENENLVRIVNYVDVYKNSELILKEKEYMLVSTSEEKIDINQLMIGDLIFTPSSETAGDIGISALVIEDLPNTAFSYHVLRFRFLKEVYLSYRKYICNNHYTLNYFSKMAKGSIRKTLGREDFKEAQVIIPTISEQKIISDYLDNRTSSIDKLIDDKQSLIEKLKEYRQAIINEAVTKGLDKNCSMKDSGVDWIGEIPISWDIYKIRRVFDIVKYPYMLEDRPVLSITQTGIKVKDITKNDGQLAQSYVGYQEVNVGDFAMNGMDLLTGNVDCSIYNGVTSPDYRVFRFKNSSKMNSDYYKHLFQQCYSRKIFYKFGQGVSNLGRWRLQTEVFLDFNIPVPALDDQVKIGNYINSKTNKINSIVNRIELQIKKLQEYKRSIISEAVTGKIKIEEHISEGVI